MADELRLRALQEITDIDHKLNEPSNTVKQPVVGTPYMLVYETDSKDQLKTIQEWLEGLGFSVKKREPFHLVANSPDETEPYHGEAFVEMNKQTQSEIVLSVLYRCITH